MTNRSESISRREFLQAAGIVGVEAFLLMACASGTTEHGYSTATGTSNLRVPKRAFGATGEMVSTLALGGE